MSEESRDLLELPIAKLPGMMDSDEAVQYKATTACRKILSREKTPPIDHMIRLGVVPRCVEFLTKAHNPSLQFEACWALTNIASGTSEQTAAVVQEGAIPRLQALLSSPRIDVAEQAVWALGNIAGDGPVTRDMVLSCVVLPDLLRLIKPNTSLSLLRNLVRAISNLCRNKNPAPDFELLKPALPFLARLLNHNDSDVQADTCWALSYLTDGPNEKIQAVLDTGLIDRLVQLLYSDQGTVLTPALKAVGNIVSGNDQQTDMVINAGALIVLSKLLAHTRLNIVKEAAWTVSNITAGNSEQIQKVLDAGIMPPLLYVLQTGDFKSQKEAAWAVTNYTSGGTISQLAKLVELGALKPMCNLLNSKDYKTVLVVLDGLSNILILNKHASEVEYLKEILEDKKNDLMEAKSNNQFLTDENLYIRMELDSIKSQPLGNNTKGNSLFAEVDDRRVYLQDKINKMNESYLSLRQEKNQLETMNRHLKLENLRLLEKWNADIDEIDYDYAQEKLILRGTIQNLEDTVKKYKKELAEKPWIISKLSFEEHEYFQVSLKELKDEIKSLKEKNVLYALNETFVIKELSEVKAELRKWRLEAITMENELLLQNDIENQTANNEQQNKNLDKFDYSRSSDAKKTSLKGKLSDIGVKQNLSSEKKDNFENKHEVVENKENIPDETKNSASEVHPKRVTFANDYFKLNSYKKL